MFRKTETAKRIKVAKTTSRCFGLILSVSYIDALSVFKQLAWRFPNSEMTVSAIQKPIQIVDADKEEPLVPRAVAGT
jgi:hypothetical protein